jgi:TatD DNase family protein
MYGIFYFPLKTSIPYVNLHTHLPRQEGVLSIYNNGLNINSSDPYLSAGIHPWYIDNSYEKKLESLRKLARKKKVIAIGECGLDKLTDSSFTLQEQIFIEQIKIAEEVRKPLIIHCVKAFDDLIRIKKKMAVKVPCIVHGYNNNEQIAIQLFKHGFFLSFGKAILTNDSNAFKTLRIAEAGKFFLETDDAALPISLIFTKAAEIKETGINELKQELFLNFKLLFNYG